MPANSLTKQLADIHMATSTSAIQGDNGNSHLNTSSCFHHTGPHPVTSPFPSGPVLTPHRIQYDDIQLTPLDSSSCAAKADDARFWLDQTWRYRLGVRVFSILTSTGLVWAVASMMRLYKETKGESERYGKGKGQWRQDQGGVDSTPVVVLLSIGGCILGSSVLLAGVHWFIPTLRKVTRTSNVLTTGTSLLLLGLSLASVIFGYIHPTSQTSPQDSGPISMMKYACYLKAVTSQSESGREATYNVNAPPGSIRNIPPLQQEDSIPFSEICEQWSLALFLAIILPVLEMLIFATVLFGIFWKKRLETIEMEERGKLKAKMIITDQEKALELGG